MDNARGTYDEGADVEELRTTSDPEPGGDFETEVDDTNGGIFSPAFKRRCRALLKARDDYDEADKLAKALKKERDELELDVFELFENLLGDGQKTGQTLPVPLGEPYGTVKFRPRETYYAKIVDEDELLEYLNERALTEEVSGTSFVKKRLHEMVRTAKEHNSEMPPGLTFYTDRGMTITRPK
jgi:hypothetical protein